MNLLEDIDKYYNSKESKPRERDYFYVSEIGKSKKEIFNNIKSPKAFACDARVRRILENGDYVHMRFTKAFAEMGILVAAEINAVSNDLIHGRLDCIITDREKNYIVEMKSCSMWTFNKLDKPLDAHELQIQTYLYYMNIEDGILLYENKDNQTIKTFDIKLDRPKVEKIIKELEQLKKNIAEGVEPVDEPIYMKDLE